MHQIFHFAAASMAAVNEAPPISSYTKEKVARAKFTLEHFYNNLVNETEERENRYVAFKETGFVYMPLLSIQCKICLVIRFCIPPSPVYTTGTRNWSKPWKKTASQTNRYVRA